MTACTGPSLLQGVDAGTLQTWLTEAQAAYRDVSIGGKAVTVIVTGGGQHREVTFDKTNLAQLSNWIAMLQAALGLNGGRPRRRAIPVTF